MPYFFILPIYAILLAAGLLLGLGFLCFARTRPISGLILSGTFGTLPGFVIGNILFWAVFVGVAMLLKIPVEHFKDSDVAGGIAGFALIFFMIGGLALANVLGCVSGFFAGCWAYAKVRKRWIQPTMKPLQPGQP